MILFFHRLFGHFIAGQSQTFSVQLIVTQTNDFVRRRLKVPIGDNDQIDPMTHFYARNVDAFFVEQEGADIDRYLAMQRAGIFLHGLFFEDAQDVQRGRFRTANVAGAGATRTSDVAGFGQSRTQTLARKFEQAKA